MKILILPVLLALFGIGHAESYWPNGAQLVIAVDMQLESGGQPEGAASPLSGDPLPEKYHDTAADTWWAYGWKEGIERLLNLWKKYGISVNALIIGEAALNHPEIVKDIAAGGHEISAHGMWWIPGEDAMDYETERKFIKNGADILEKLTGEKPLGYNAYWMRRSKNTLKILQELGFTYHVDDVSRDEPFVTMVEGKKFGVVPHTIKINDIVLVEAHHFSAEQFLSQLKREFDVLYAEGKTRRRMMSLSTHDRISGQPAFTSALDDFIRYAQQFPGVVFMKKKDIAQIVLTEKDPLIDNSEKFEIIKANTGF
jgi:peptidoglycan/xylan/chitin deacetylase (PgdA/CDA1 family)